MVAQRLAQGFQLVILPNKTSPSDVTNLSSSPYSSGASSLVRASRNKAKAMVSKTFNISLNFIFKKEKQGARLNLKEPESDVHVKHISSICFRIYFFTYYVILYYRRNIF